MSITSFTSHSTRALGPGVQLPLIGLGVYQARSADCTNAVTSALKLGYRHFDSALAYRNESLVGDALRNSGIPRSELFFTTKLPPKLRGYEATRKAIDESLKNCGLGYIDLYLIHAPYGTKETRLGQWRAIEEAVEDKKIKAAGVSNYGIHHLQELLQSSVVIRPQVNQIELHPFCSRKDLVHFCQSNDISIEAYSPLTRGMKLSDPTLAEVALNYGKSTAQVLIRWSLQKGFVPLPKSITTSRIKENFDVFDFAITEADMDKLDSLDEYLVTGWDPTKEPL